MNYEKAYREALERAKKAKNNVSFNAQTHKVLDIIFPELKESEDEKIRKYLLKLADRCPEDSIDFMRGVKKGDIIAWLEKQGEKKPIEWKDSDEKYLFWALLSIQKDIAASEINGVNTKDLNDCVKWLYSLKQRIKGE